MVAFKQASYQCKHSEIKKNLKQPEPCRRNYTKSAAGQYLEMMHPKTSDLNVYEFFYDKLFSSVKKITLAQF